MKRPGAVAGESGSPAESFQAGEESQVAAAAGGRLPQQALLVPGGEPALEDVDDADLGADDLGYDDSLLVSTEAEPAACGICQVWVHRQHRRKGVATRLLQAALECSGFLDGGLLAPSSQCAFSQVRRGRALVSQPASVGAGEGGGGGGE